MEVHSRLHVDVREAAEPVVFHFPDACRMVNAAGNSSRGIDGAKGSTTIQT